MEEYHKAPPEEKKKEIWTQGLDILYDVVPKMLAEVIDEVLEEEATQIPDEFALFDMVFDFDEEAGTLTQVVADDALEENAPEPSSVDFPAPPSPPNPPVQEGNFDAEEEEHRQYVMDRRNTNTIKKTESISSNDQPSLSPTSYCRDSWENSLTEQDFANLTCSKCLVQLFNDRLPFTIRWPVQPPYGLLHKHWNISLVQPEHELMGDPESYPSVVCTVCELGEQECSQWRQCCMAARRCCKKMLKWGKDENHCPGTWDGVACWGPTAPATEVSQLCPNYYARPEAMWMSPHANKYCTTNVSWWVRPGTDIEHTDVVACVDITAYQNLVRVSLYIDIAGNGLSVIALVTSIAVIVGFRSLRRDLLSRDSLKLHLNLFVAMILAGLASLALHYIYFDADIIKANPVWCRVLNGISKYFRSVTYIAIFSEGLYLHRRISRVLYVSRREPLLKYFLISWIVPALTVIAYIVTRVVLDQNKGCWMHPANSELEFIYMVPNALTIVCNVGFLISIEINLCTKMRTDSSDRRVEVLRHALRATLTLIPMFGLQFFFFAYRPEMWPPYEIIYALFISTQGFLVAVVYCLSTKEVRSQLFLFSKHCSIKCGDVCRVGHSNKRRGRCESTSSALHERGIIDHDGYLYMGQRRASHSPGYLPSRRDPRRSLPDVIDSVSMTQATRTTSMGSSLCDIKDRGSLMNGLSSRRVSHDSTSPRRPSGMSLTLPCLCGAMRMGRICTCHFSNGGGVRTSLLPLLGVSSSDHSSNASTEAAIPLEEKEEEEEETLKVTQREHGEGKGSQNKSCINNDQISQQEVTTSAQKQNTNHTLADVAL